MIKTDLCIIGSGPSALFAIFEAGQHHMRCHLIGGWYEENKDFNDLQDNQLSAILNEKIAVFKPGFSTDEWVEDVIQDGKGHYILITNKKTEICCKSVVISMDYRQESLLPLVCTANASLDTNTPN